MQRAEALRRDFHPRLGLGQATDVSDDRKVEAMGQLDAILGRSLLDALDVGEDEARAPDLCFARLSIPVLGACCASSGAVAIRCFPEIPDWGRPRSALSRSHARSNLATMLYNPLPVRVPTRWTAPEKALVWAAD